jgi:hypothetical protein
MPSGQHWKELAGKVKSGRSPLATTSDLIDVMQKVGRILVHAYRAGALKLVLTIAAGGTPSPHARRAASMSQMLSPTITADSAP